MLTTRDDETGMKKRMALPYQQRRHYKSGRESFP